MGFFAWIKSLFGKVSAIISRGWSLAGPFLKEFLRASLANMLPALQDLALQAVTQIAAQGLPNDEAKRKAFADFMLGALKAKGLELKDSELNLLRETALAIWKKSQEESA